MMRFFTLAIAAVTAIAAVPASAASTVTWQTPTTITSAEQALSLGGGIVYAVAWTGISASTMVTLANSQQVEFQAGTIDGSGIVQVAGAAGICGSNCSEYNGTSNAAFNYAVGGFAWDGVHTITLTGLTVGASYRAQFFSLDDRGCCSSKTNTFSDTLGNVSSSFVHGDNQFVLGDFKASGTTQTFIGQGSSGPCVDGTCPNLNAVVLYSASAVPEPASWAMLIAGFGLVGAKQRRRRSLSVAA